MPCVLVVCAWLCRSMAGKLAAPHRLMGVLYSRLGKAMASKLAIHHRLMEVLRTGRPRLASWLPLIG